MYDRKEIRTVGLGLEKEIDQKSVKILTPNEKDFQGEPMVEDEKTFKLTPIPSVIFVGKYKYKEKHRLKVKKFVW